MDWIYAIITLLSIVAAILAWIAKLWWAKEYRAAKDETIKAKEAQIEVLKTQIENLKELNPVKIREFFVSMKMQLEENIDLLKSQLDTAKAEITQRSTEIDRLSLEGDKKRTELQKLQSEKKQAEEKVQLLTGEVKQLRETFQMNLTQLLGNLDKIRDYNYRGRFGSRFVSRFGSPCDLNDLIAQLKLMEDLKQKYKEMTNDKKDTEKNGLKENQGE